MSDAHAHSLSDLLPASHRDDPNDPEGMYDFLQSLQNDSHLHDEDGTHGDNITPMFSTNLASGLPTSATGPASGGRAGVGVAPQAQAHGVHQPASQAQTHSQAQAPITTPGPARPTQPSIPIPQALLAIADQHEPLDFDFTDPALAIPYEANEDRGEMGGRRKKALEERAGWKEMQERGTKRVRGPRAKKGSLGGKGDSVDAFVGVADSSSFAAPAGSRAPMTQHTTGGIGRKRPADEMAMSDEAANTLAMDLAAAEAEAHAHAHAHAQAGTDGKELDLESNMLADVLMQSGADLGDIHGLDGVGGAGGAGSGMAQGAEEGGGAAQEQAEEDALRTASESRAQQNRRAQQVYRRRREERMKELETQAANLEPTRRALFDTYEKMKDLFVEYEASKFQISALQNTLLTLSSQGVSVLTPDGSIPMSAPPPAAGTGGGKADAQKVQMKMPPPGRAAVEAALNTLVMQARELAKSRRGE